MPGMVAEAVRILHYTRKSITQRELLQRVALVTNRPVDTVRGTVIGFRPDKLMGLGMFSNWVYCRKPTRFVRKKYAKRSEWYKPTYDTPQKDEARLRSFSEFIKLDLVSPKVLTLGAEKGFCVRRILKIAPAARITNIENNPRVLDVYRRQGLPSENVLADLETYVAENPLDFDYLNLDLVGYLSQTKYEMFAEINRKTTASAISITIQHGERFRNYGYFIQWAKSRFLQRDQIKQAMRTALSNFRLVDDFSYIRDKTCGCRPMRVFVFRRKD